MLCLLFVAAVDYGRVFYYAVSVQNCARNGAYYAGNYAPGIYAYPDVNTAAQQDATNLSPTPSVTLSRSVVMQVAPDVPTFSSSSSTGSLMGSLGSDLTGI